jgi:hypothetical protein
VKAPRALQSVLQSAKYFTKKEQKLPWLPKNGLLKLDSQDFRTMPMKLFCSQKERFYRKNVKIQQKMYVAIL